MQAKGKHAARKAFAAPRSLPDSGAPISKRTIWAGNSRSSQLTAAARLTPSDVCTVARLRMIMKRTPMDWFRKSGLVAPLRGGGRHVRAIRGRAQQHATADADGDAKRDHAA